MAVVEMPDKDLELLQRLLSSLSLNLSADELLHQPAHMLITYVAIFVYETLSGGRVPDGREARDALVQDVQRLRAHLEERPPS